MLPASFADRFFGSAGTDKFIQNRLIFAGSVTEDPAEPLDMFSDTAAAGNHDPDRCLRHINSFVEDFTGDKDRILPGTEVFQKRFAFGGFGVMGEYRQRKLSADSVCRIIIGGKNNDPFSGVPGDDIGDP